MKIRLVNKGSRNELQYEKRDGNSERAGLGPRIPFHDLAHFIVERELKLEHGFYGNLYNGYSVKQLSDKNMISRLSVQSAVAEIVTRALQSLSSGACTVDQFLSLIGEELVLYSIDYPLVLDRKQIIQMLSDYQQLVAQWEQLSEGGAMELNLQLERSAERMN